MRFCVVVLFVKLMLWGPNVCAQDIPPVSVPDPTYHAILHFDFTHSLRIPDHHVTVDLNGLNPTNIDSVDVHAVSEPMPGHGWQEAVIDTTFRIGRDKFERLVKTVNAIPVPKVTFTTSLSIGTDGYWCVIKFGDMLYSVAIEVWTPTERTGPSGYYAACRQFLEIGGFDPDVIFDR